jgi:hypothetical protein
MILNPQVYGRLATGDIVKTYLFWVAATLEIYADASDGYELLELVSRHEVYRETVKNKTAVRA